MDPKVYRQLFEDFCAHLSIDSKETGVTKLSDPWGSQRAYVDAIFNGIEDNKRTFLCLKSRQLGISTYSLAIDLFWLGLHPGLQGALIVHDEDAREQFRQTMVRYLEMLPKSHRIPIVVNNRQHMIFENGSILSYLVAGTRKKGNLARGKGLNFVHATECSSWGDPDSLASLEASLARKSPNRLYMFESTAKGFGMWHDMYYDAKEDPSKLCMFIGWWTKELNTIERDDPLFAHYWTGELSDDEVEMITRVKADYGHEITPEQLAWYRHESRSMLTEQMMRQEHPSYEEEAFQMSGSPFFNPKLLTRIMPQAKREPYKAYRYHMGQDFLASTMEKMADGKLAHLKIWAEPVPHGVYAIGADPPGGSTSKDADRGVIQVLRCYADGAEQVAELATTGLEIYQFAWACCHLLGLYKDAMFILEVNGAGQSVWQEISNIKRDITAGPLRERAEEMKVTQIFDAVRWYLYNRIDSVNKSASVYHWKTNYDNKRRILISLKDALQQNVLKIRSTMLLEEMKGLEVEEDSIEAKGRNKDDRVMAMAFAYTAHMEWMRKKMIADNRTIETERRRDDITDAPTPITTAATQALRDFFRRAEEQRARRY
jgi:hypothetical protein